MKKLLSVFAAAAVLFGFASCSGDMHDSVVSSLYAEGDFCEKDGDTTVRVKFDMTPGSDTEQTYVFKYDSKMTAWGGSNGTVNFKIVRDETGWLKDWGWLKDTKVELSVNSTEWLDLEGRGGSNDNPGNIVLKDLVVGNSYKLILKYDAPAEKVSIKCTGAVTDYPILKAHIVDAADGTVGQQGLAGRLANTPGLSIQILQTIVVGTKPHTAVDILVDTDNIVILESRFLAGADMVDAARTPVDAENARASSAHPEIVAPVYIKSITVVIAQSTVVHGEKTVVSLIIIAQSAHSGHPDAAVALLGDVEDALGVETVSKIVAVLLTGRE